MTKKILKDREKLSSINRSVALIFLLLGLLLSSLLLNIKPVETDFMAGALLGVQIILPLILGSCLLFIALLPSEKTDLYYSTTLLLAVLGCGFLFLYATLNFTENFLSTPSVMAGLIGEIAKLIGAFLVVTASFLWFREHISIEKTLREQKKKLRREHDYIFQIFESMETYVFVANQNYEIEFINRKAREDFGDLVGTQCYRHHKRESPCPDCPVPKLKGEGENEAVNFRIEVFDRMLEGTATTIENLDGSFSILEVLSDVTERHKKEQTIRYMSFHDMLTGLYNRNFAAEELNRLNTKRQYPLSIIMGDVNGLKMVNDALGHDYGDHLLKKTADLLRSACREEDIISRWGGDEFVILLPQTPHVTAAEICSRIKELSKSSYIEKIPISLALGFTTKENDEIDLNSIMNQAEERMYQNKMTQANGVHVKLLNNLAAVLREKSHETEEHCRRLQQMAVKLGEELGLPSIELDRLSLVAFLHDIGKTAIPDNIMMKDSNLTSKEWDVIKTHPHKGFRIVSQTEEFSNTAYPILYHHERWDGKGYPSGLKGKEIPQLSRIIAIVDAFDAMVNERPYSKGLSIEKAYEELERNAGTHFDPELVKLFLKIAKEGNFELDTLQVQPA